MTVAILVNVGIGSCTTGVSVEDGFEVTGLAFGSVPEAVAVLWTTPASTSACKIVYGETAVHVVDACGANGVAGQVTAPALASETVRLVMVTVPVFLTRNDHWIVSPKSVLPSLFTSVTAAD